MKVLVACEESQTVCSAFRELGHEAYSCDLQECSGGHPEWHIRGNVIPLLNGNVKTVTDGGVDVSIDGPWDLLIAHPPCTYLCVTGNRWFDIEKYGEKAKKRYVDRNAAIVFFMQIALANAKSIAIENPVGIMSTAWKKPEQIIHPYMFALSEEENTMKATCLWLKGLPQLIPSHSEMQNVAFHEWETPDGRKKRQTQWYYQTRCLPHSERAKAASKTFPGIAKAMAEQWGGQL